tara:strand:+ start:948 stop:1298 length:351 start_codon:yes stop_codon:yes gene_type:complete
MSNFENDIKEWVSIDNKIKTINDELRTLRETRNDKTDKILQYVETNSLNNATVNITDGKLKFVASRQTTPLTLKHVEECLNKCIADEQQVKVVIDYIKNSRPVKVSQDIKRSYNNN